MMTNYLRKEIKAQLNSLVPYVYYQLADRDAMYPHIVLNLENTTMLDNDRHRFDYSLIVDIYNRLEVNEIEEITDKVIDILNNLNLPTNDILPTFYLETRRSLIDEDKTINHRQLEFVVQTYERK